MHKLDPSKENCRQARTRLANLLGELGVRMGEHADADYIDRFLQAAAGALRSQANIDKYRAKRKNPGGSAKAW